MVPLGSCALNIEDASNSTRSKDPSHHQGRNWLKQASEIQTNGMSDRSQALASGHLISPAVSSSCGPQITKPIKLTLHTYNSERDRSAIEAIIAQNPAEITGLDINCIEKNENGLKEKLEKLPKEFQATIDPTLFDVLMKHMNTTKTKVLKINDETIGFFTYSLINNNSIVSIDQIAIHGNHQRKHYGKNLFALIMKNLKKDNDIQESHVAVSKINRVACEFYKSIGFKPYTDENGAIISLKKTER